ncbi:hypothetical protein [Streptomyces sp. NPDC002265]|uniref:hypothetical protein n=1 Tax=Streptomyces sp. NPDC002265 TaxID=3154415 RepID=UPI003325983E
MGDTIQSVLVNIALGLVTSLLGGGFVWLGERAKRARELNRRAEFFGVRPGETCLVVLGGKHDAPGSAHYADVRAVVEFSLLVGELGCEAELEPGDFRGSNGDRTEFCVGGPLGSNVRTGGHLAAHLPGVTVHPYRAGDPESVAIEVGGEKFPYSRRDQEYALVAKFTPGESGRPVFLVCGQSATGNLAAVHFLRREFGQVARRLPSAGRFCLLIKVSGIGTYGHHRAELERDVSAAAFG